MITFDDMLTQVGAFQQPQARKSLALGLASRLVEKKWGAARVAAHLPGLNAAIAANQFAFCFDAQARAVAFISWATVDAARMDRLIASGPAALGGGEWASGDNLWIMDFYVHVAMLPLVLLHLRDHVLDRHASAAYFRYRGGYRIAKQLTRADLSGFFGERRAAASLAQQKPAMNFDVLRERRESFMQYHQVGQIMRTLIQAGPAAPALLRSAHLVRTIATLRQFRVYEDAGGCPNGMLTWAWLSERTIARIEQQPLHAVHVSEWNEGETLCFFDVATSAASRAETIADVAGRLFPDQRHCLLYRASSAAAPAQCVPLDRQCPGDVIDRWLAASPAVSGVLHV